MEAGADVDLALILVPVAPPPRCLCFFRAKKMGLTMVNLDRQYAAPWSSSCYSNTAFWLWTHVSNESII